MQVAELVDRGTRLAMQAERRLWGLARSQMLELDRTVRPRNGNELDIVLGEHRMSDLTHANVQALSVLQLERGHMLLVRAIRLTSAEFRHRFAAARGHACPVHGGPQDGTALLAAEELELGHDASFLSDVLDERALCDGQKRAFAPYRESGPIPHGALTGKSHAPGEQARLSPSFFPWIAHPYTPSAIATYAFGRAGLSTRLCQLNMPFRCAPLSAQASRASPAPFTKAFGRSQKASV